MTSAPTRARRWLERLNGSKHMLWLLALFSFLETLIVPVPIELVLIPLMALNRQRIWRIATVTTAGQPARASVTNHVSAKSIIAKSIIATPTASNGVGEQ